MTETTALRYLRETIAAGLLVEVGHAGRRLLLPWPDGTQSPPDVWVTGEVKRGTFRVTEFREPGPTMAKIRFVMTPERLKARMDGALDAEKAKAAKKEREAEDRRAKQAAQEAEERALFAKTYPSLAALLARLHERVTVPGGLSGGVRVWAKEHPEVGVLGRVNLEVDFEEFGALEEILRDGLGAEGERG
ncbi:hypothetical protein ACFVXC_06125 [Streptomyces sp. NPDC058257]|uniref:hypothetical protein n=1 Tax=Streptomyces sp. NPDC058257 TaxID=3346409 RepID=UPI0036E6F6C9